MFAAPRVLTAAQRALDHPELVSAVFQELAKGDLYNFLTVNRYFFELAIRHVWRDVPDVRHVLALMGGPLLVDHIAVWHEAAPRIIFPSQIRQSQLARFDIYKRHVRTLEIFSDPDKPILWVELASIGLPHTQYDPSNTGDVGALNADPTVAVNLPLLPKLRILEVIRHSAGGARSTSHELYQWIRLFCSETCTTVRVVGLPYLRACWMNAPNTADTFHLLTQRYANLERLELFSKPSRFSLDDVVAFDRALLQQIADFLRHSPRLATLSLGCDAISPCVLAELARMPNLHTLRFRYHRGASIVVDKIPIGEWCFPRLTCLELYDVQPKPLLDFLLNRLLFRNLHALAVELDILALLDEPDEVIRPIFREIVEAAPQLRDLGFVLPQSASSTACLLPTTIGVLGGLNLLRLRLECVGIHGTEGFAQFHNMWPALQELLWLDQQATTDDLAAFARRESLEVLAVSLAGVKPAPSVGANVAPINPGSFQLQSDFYLHDFNSDDLENYARYLRSCWGGIVIEMVDQPATALDSLHLVDLSHFHIIQDHLQSLREAQ